MNLIPYTPTALEELRRWDRVFGRLFGRDPETRTTNRLRTPIDVVETEDEVIITAELAGVKADDVELTVEDHLLTIKGEKKRAELPEGARTSYEERAYGEFVRTVRLAGWVDESNPKATFHDGTLEIRLGKKAEAKPRKVKIAKK